MTGAQLLLLARALTLAVAHPGRVSPFEAELLYDLSGRFLAEPTAVITAAEAAVLEHLVDGLERQAQADRRAA